MAISPTTITRSSVLAGLNNNQRGGTAYCATCGRAASVTQSAYGNNFAGRTASNGSSDSYYCVTCNRGLTNNYNTANARTANQTSTYGRTNASTSSYCPSCNQTPAPASHWSGNAASNSGNSSFSGPSWVR